MGWCAGHSGVVWGGRGTAIGTGGAEGGTGQALKKRASKGYSPPAEGGGQDQSRKQFEVCKRLRARTGPN